MPDMDLAAGGTRVRELVRLVGLVLVTIVVARSVGRTEAVIQIVALAATAALLTAPVTAVLARRIPRGVAAAVTALLSFAAVVAVVALVLRSASLHVAEVSDALSERLASLRPGTLPERVSRSLQAQEALDEALSGLPASILTGEEDPVGIARRSVDIFLIVILAAFFQNGAGRVVETLVTSRPRPRRAALRDLAADVEQRGGGHVRRALLLGTATWAVVALVATALGLPGPLLLGAWAAAWSVVPWVGGWAGLAPFVALAAGDDPAVLAAALAAATAVALGVGAVRRRFVEGHSFVLGPALGVLALACGSRVAGLPGALMAFTLVSAAMAVATSPHRPGTEPAMDDDAADAPRPPLLGPLVTVVDGHGRLAPGWRGASTVLAGAVLGALAWMLVGASGRVLTWLAVAALVAVALDRAVELVRRRTHLPRPAAVTVVCMAGALVLGGAGALGAGGAASSSSQVQAELPQAIADLEDAPVVGSWLRDRDASVWVSEQLENLPQRLSEVRVAEWLPTVGERMVDLGWTLLLALGLLVDGPRLGAALHRRVPARHRRQVTRLTRVSHAAIAGYLAGAVLVAGINATVVFAIALALGIGLAPVLAVWAFVWNFVPQIGGFMGGFPLVVLALAKGPAAALAAGFLFVSYQFVENHLIQPAVIGGAIDVPAWVALLAALAGGALGGVVGAVVLTPLVGMAKVALDELRRDDFPGATMRSTSDVVAAETPVAVPRPLP